MNTISTLIKLIAFSFHSNITMDCFVQNKNIYYHKGHLECMTQEFCESRKVDVPRYIPIVFNVYQQLAFHPIKSFE